MSKLEPILRLVFTALQTLRTSCKGNCNLDLHLAVSVVFVCIRVGVNQLSSASDAFFSPPDSYALC